jgi:Holliday junction DNA helicase RuvB
MSSSPNQNAPDKFLDQTLRPTAWGDYVGQKQTKENLQILLTAAKQREQSPEHLLFYGPPGLGKTTLAHLIAEEMGAQMKVTSGPAIERVGDLASILTNLSTGDVLFIDEIHRLNRSIEEILYPVMESGRLDIIIGKGPSARTVQLEIPSFTLVAATTRIGLLSSPLRSRFSGGTFKLSFYDEDELVDIVKRSSEILGIHTDKEILKEIAKRGRRTPRTTNYLLKRCRDFAQVQNKAFSKELIGEALGMLGIDELGLSSHDRLLLKTLAEKFNGGPVGLGTLATALSEDTTTIEEVHEPHLMQLGFLERTPRGRVVTKRGYEHVGITPPTEYQEELL